VFYADVLMVCGLLRAEAIAEKHAVRPDLSRLRKAISKVHKASTKLDHVKHKAEKNLRKALLRLGKKLSRHGHRKHRRTCLKRRWNKFKNFVKSVFGVHPDFNKEQHDVEARTPEYEEVKLDDAESTEPIVWEEGEQVSIEGPPVSVEFGHVTVEKPSTFNKVRVGLAGGQSPEGKREEGGSILDKIRVGRAGAGRWRTKRDTTLHVPRFTTDHPDHDNGADMVDRGSRRSRPCMIIPYIDLSPWAVSSDPGVPMKGPLKKVIKAARAVRRVNAKLARFETGFIHEAGIKDREWYRHLGVSPGKWLGYGATTFPALTEALEEKNLTLATVEAERLAKLVEDLAKFLSSS